MIHHDTSWCIMMHHESIMIVSWCIMIVYHRVSSCITCIMVLFRRFLKKTFSWYSMIWYDSYHDTGYHDPFETYHDIFQNYHDTFKMYHDILKIFKIIMILSNYHIMVISKKIILYFQNNFPLVKFPNKFKISIYTWK